MLGERNEKQDKPPASDADEGLLDVRRIEGKLKKSSVKKIDDIVEKHPNKTLDVVRHWLHDEKR